MLRLPLLFFLFLSSAPFFAQDGEKRLLEADSLYDLKEDEKAFQEYEKAVAAFRESGNYLLMAKAVERQARIYNRLSQREKAVALLNEKAPILAKEIPGTFELGRIYNFQGYVLTRTDQIGQALTAYENALLQFQAADQFDDSVIFALKEAAQLCIRNLEYERALTFLRAAENEIENSRYRFNIFNSFFLSYYYQGDYQAAKNYFQKAEAAIARPKDSNKLHRTGFLLFKELEDFQGARESFNTLQQFDADSLMLLNYEAQLAEWEGNTSNSEVLYQAYFDGLEPLLTDKSRENAKLLCELGDHYLSKGQIPKALELFHLAVIQVYPTFDNSDIYSIPNRSQAQQESWAMTSAHKKAKALYLVFGESRNLKDLNLSCQYYRLALASAEEVRRAYRSDQAAVALAEFGYNWIEDALQAQYELYAKTGSPEDLEAIFNWMERNRAGVLAESIQRNRNSELLNIPDSLVLAEKELRQQLLAARLQDAPNTDHIDSLQNAYTILNRTIQSEYPDWERYLSSFKPVSLPDLQQFLQKKEASMMLYFWGAKKLYCLQIHGRGAEMHSPKGIKEIDQSARNFLGFFENRQAIANDPSAYAQRANQLFKLLELDKLPAPENLWIIPDGLLNYIPFEALLTASAESTDPSNWPFLILEKNIRIGVSASLTAQHFSVPKEAGKVLAWAPEFSKRERGLEPLPQSVAEVQSWGDTEFVKMETGDQCTWTAFQKDVPQARIIHLATHARVNPKTLDPEIEIIDKTLGLSELYQMEYPNSLIILSACESGLGQYRRGEGLMNLNRAFTYNGAQTVIASLWNVNDAITSRIMQHFTNRVMDKEESSQALREAKIDLLRDLSISPDKKTPYYWAALTYNGPEFRYQQKGFDYRLLILGLGVLIGAWLLRRWMFKT
ncbi:MAG: CHAT domain-containing protein [Bacteroidetes bacterium]|nr:CHAT domain-containing protein [Bacteroidota bacterium]